MMVSKKTIKKSLERSKELKETEHLIPTQEEIKESDSTFMRHAKNLKKILKPSWFLGKRKEKKKR